MSFGRKLKCVCTLFVCVCKRNRTSAAYAVHTPSWIVPVSRLLAKYNNKSLRNRIQNAPESGQAIFNGKHTQIPSTTHWPHQARTDCVDVDATLFVVVSIRPPDCDGIIMKLNDVKQWTGIPYRFQIERISGDQTKLNKFILWRIAMSAYSGPQITIAKCLHRFSIDGPLPQDTNNNINQLSMRRQSMSVRRKKRNDGDVRPFINANWLHTRDIIPQARSRQVECALLGGCDALHRHRRWHTNG